MYILALLAVGWSGKRHDSENSRADPLCDGFDRPAFARAITAFKHDDDAQSFVFHPVLEQAELRVKPKQLFFVVFSLHFLVLHISTEVRSAPFTNSQRLESVCEDLNPVNSSEKHKNFQELPDRDCCCLLLHLVPIPPQANIDPTVRTSTD
jgi:hypothetical protein